MRKEKQWEWCFFFVVVVNPMKHMRLISASGSVAQEFQPPSVLFFLFFFYSQVILAVGGIPHSENPFQKNLYFGPWWCSCASFVKLPSKLDGVGQTLRPDGYQAAQPSSKVGYKQRLVQISSSVVSVSERWNRTDRKDALS